VAAPDPTRLKVHRRTLGLDHRRSTVLALRPATEERFATNRFHQMWHVLSDVAGAHLLGRLCWAMAHERRPGTFAVIDPRFLVPNPFDADPSSPIVVVNNDLGPFSRPMAAALWHRLPFTTPSEGTVVLRTPGLDGALAAGQRPPREWNRHQQRHWIERVHGLVVIAGPPPMLREWAMGMARLGNGFHQGSDYVELGWSPDGADGEIQILEDFAARVVTAQAARERLFPGRARAELTQEERERVWQPAAGTGAET
jgi:hypothetical protein